MNKYLRLVSFTVIGIAFTGLTASATDVNILGSNGWTDSWGVGTPDYATDVFTGGATALSGNAALRYDGVAGDLGAGVDHLFATPLTGQVEIKYNLFIPTGHNGAYFVAYYLTDASNADVTSLGGAYANPDGYLQIEEWGMGVSGPSLTRGVWQEIKMVFDFTAGTAQYFKDGVAVGTPASMTATKISGFGYPYRTADNGTTWTGPIYFDNFSVTHNGTVIWSDNFDSYISAGNADLVSVDFVIGGFPFSIPDGATVPASGDTTASGAVNNPTGLIFTGQTGPWNAFNIDSGYGNDTIGGMGPSASLKNGAGADTTVKLAITNSYRCSTGDGGLIGSLRNEAAANFAGWGLSDDPVNMELTGLDPARNYSLVVFSDPDGIYTANGVAAVRDTEGDANWASVSPDSSGNIAISLLTNNGVNGYVGMYGLQLLKLAAPTALTAHAGADQTVSATTPSATIGGTPTAVGGTGPYTYSWSPPTDLSNPAVANPTASPTTTTIYTVTVTDSASPTPATTTASVTITYLAANPQLISVDFVYDGLGGANSGVSAPCSGDTTLTGTTMNNAAGNIFTGQFGPWNAIDVGGNNSNNNSAISGFLTNGAGTATTVKFAMGLATGLASTPAGSWRDNYVSDVTGGGGATLRSECSYCYGATGTADHYAWAFTGLAPNTAYKLTFFGTSSTATTSNVAFPGTAQQANGVKDSENDWNWTSITSDAGGKISGTFTDPPNSAGAALCGAQIEQLAPTGTPYEIWAATHAGHQPASEDANNDGVSNGVAFFMGQDGVTTNPGILNGKVTWPHVGVVSSYNVQVSTDLGTWTDANPADVTIDSIAVPPTVSYTFPTGSGIPPKKFCRLQVIP